MLKNLSLLLIVAVVVVFSGCTTDSGAGGYYGNVDDDVYGSRENLEYPQKSRAITEMVERLLTDPGFTDFYGVAAERAAARDHRLPTLIIQRIEDNTQAGGSDFRSTGQMRNDLKSTLRKTGKFTIIDLAERARMTNVVTAEVDGGGQSENIQNFGEYEAGDFLMSGELTRDSVGGQVYYHFFNLRLMDPVTGAEIWSDTVKVRKD
ncbi:MAG: hypothetical protein IKS83_03605 [Victivallales bacterium]|nr:hypothetical protein [Victivallales bacterium]